MCIRDSFYTKPWKGAVLRENIREGFRLHARAHGPLRIADAKATA